MECRLASSEPTVQRHVSIPFKARQVSPILVVILTSNNVHNTWTIKNYLNMVWNKKILIKWLRKIMQMTLHWINRLFCSSQSDSISCLCIEMKRRLIVVMPLVLYLFLWPVMSLTPIPQYLSAFEALKHDSVIAMSPTHLIQSAMSW